MAETERGPTTKYEVIWTSGHVDHVEAHQVSHTGRGLLFRSDLFGAEPDEPERVEFHGEFDGRWQLVLSAPMAQIETIRNVSVCGEGL